MCFKIKIVSQGLLLKKITISLGTTKKKSEIINNILPLILLKQDTYHHSFMKAYVFKINELRKSFQLQIA